jgi:hypothetical protein
VPLAGQEVEHLLRLSFARRLAKHASVAADDRVDAEDRPLTSIDRPSLARRVLERVVAELVVAGRDDVEGDAELFQDRAAL